MAVPTAIVERPRRMSGSVISGLRWSSKIRSAEDCARGTFEGQLRPAARPHPRQRVVTLPNTYLAREPVELRPRSALRRYGAHPCGL